MSKLRSVNNVVTCLTCAAIAAKEQADASAIAAAVWECSWDLAMPDEEDEAFEHAQANPTHIIVQALDFGYRVNGV